MPRGKSEVMSPAETKIRRDYLLLHTLSDAILTKSVTLNTDGDVSFEDVLLTSLNNDIGNDGRRATISFLIKEGDILFDTNRPVNMPKKQKAKMNREIDKEHNNKIKNIKELKINEKAFSDGLSNAKTETAMKEAKQSIQLLFDFLKQTAENNVEYDKCFKFYVRNGSTKEKRISKGEEYDVKKVFGKIHDEISNDNKRKDLNNAKRKEKRARKRENTEETNEAKRQKV